MVDYVNPDDLQLEDDDIDALDAEDVDTQEDGSAATDDMEWHGVRVNRDLRTLAPHRR